MVTHNGLDSDEQADLFSEVSELEAARQLIANLHDDLPSMVTRVRYLADLDGTLGRQGTLIFGGSATYSAWAEARSSFIYGNFAATVLLSQALVENLLAAFLQTGLAIDDLPSRINFRDTVKCCLDRKLISTQEFGEIERLIGLRNPLSHFRAMSDSQNIDRRSITVGLPAEDLIEQDAWFSIGLAARMLAKPPFKFD